MVLHLFYGEFKPVVNLASSTLFLRINLTERRKCGRIVVIMSLGKIIMGAFLSKVATDIAIKAVPELRPLKPAVQGVTTICVVGSLLSLAEKGQLRR